MSRKVVIAVVVGTLGLIVGGAVYLAPAIMRGFDGGLDAAVLKSFDDGCRRSARQSLASAGATGAALDNAVDGWCSCGVDIVRGMNRADMKALETSADGQRRLVEEMQRRCVPRQ